MESRVEKQRVIVEVDVQKEDGVKCSITQILKYYVHCYEFVVLCNIV